MYITNYVFYFKDNILYWTNLLLFNVWNFECIVQEWEEDKFILSGIK